jgi:F0F1-type ATP synthase assembly protein I
VFLVIGWALDAWLGIFPVFTIGLVVLAAAGMFVRLKYAYEATMQRLEAERLTRRQSPTRAEDVA